MKTCLTGLRSDLKPNKGSLGTSLMAAGDGLHRKKVEANGAGVVKRREGMLVVAFIFCGGACRFRQVWW